MLRATAIMKTDIQGSTAHFRALPEVDLDALLTGHHRFHTRYGRYLRLGIGR